MLNITGLQASVHPIRGRAHAPSMKLPRPAVAQPVSSHTLMLDEFDHGVLLLDSALQLQHANLAARRQMDPGCALQCRQGRLHARDSGDDAPLHEALRATANKGLRRMFILGGGARQLSLAVLPLETIEGGTGASALMVVLGKDRVCGELAMQWFASNHALTPAEARVLAALSAGARPGDIADSQGVSLHTVRTQISSIRAKAGADSVCELIRQLAMLPPLVSAIRVLPAQAGSSGACAGGRGALDHPTGNPVHSHEMLA